MKTKRFTPTNGFTLIEILMAITVASAAMGMIIFMITASIDMRKKALRLNQAIFLSGKYMDEIKNKPDIVDSSGEVSDYPGFRYSYSMSEISYDPFSGSTSPVQSKEQETLREYRAQKSTELATGLSFKMRQYKVILFYQEKKIYELECLRGLNVEQTFK